MSSTKPHLNDAHAAESRSETHLDTVAASFMATRSYTEHLCAALSFEDQCIQSMEDASPAKWHRAHTTWFFEQFILHPSSPGYQVFDEHFQFLFNSYYETVGPRHPRFARGMITRPDGAHVGGYRKAVDAAILAWLPSATDQQLALVTLGIHHEQQHQELLQTDILHAFTQNPLRPAAIPGWQEATTAPGPTRFVNMPGGIARIGHRGSGFAFDNESPAHQVLLAPHSLATRLVRNGEFAEFIADGGYRKPALWMADGWARVQAEGWEHPFYWRTNAVSENGWLQLTLAGPAPLNPDDPVRHISWYEADAFARWAGARLPTEAELECAHGNPQIEELAGHVWQWTNSAYLAYPGFKPASGAVGEYNGKFMINQMVLRGGSVATPPGHTRSTYRNFFQPEKRWQFSGVRLARD